MQGVLDAPVIPQPGAVILRARLLAADEIPDLARGFARHGPFAGTHADGGQTFPPLAMANALGRVQDGVAPVLLPAVAARARPVGIVSRPGAPPAQRLLEA